MKTFLLTKIVPVCLLMALSACTDKARTPSKPTPEGTRSKMGQALTNGVWCKPSTISSEGIVQLEKMVFSPDGTVVRTNYVLLSDNTLSAQGESEGTWSIIDTALVLMQPGQKTVSLQISHSVREADGAKCLNLTGAEEYAVTEQLCPCN